MKLIKFSLVDYSVSSRDIREVSAVQEMGAETHVVSSVAPKGTTHTVTELPQWKRLSSGQNPLIRKGIIAKNWLNAARYLRKLDCDAISCHNVDALFIGWLSTLGKADKPALVYDAHELEVARNVGGRGRGGLGTRAIKSLERFLMKRSAFTIAVNDSIADEMMKVHGLPESMRPIVVRSTPSYWEYDAAAVASNRATFCQDLGMDSANAFIAMYHGAIVKGRGIEQCIDAVAKVDGCGLVILGNGSASYVESLKALVECRGIADRVLFHPAVRRDVLESYVAAADVGLVIIQDVTKSYYFALPNKLFENIQAEVPVIASNFPELEHIVDGYGIGKLVDPRDTEAIAGALRLLRDDEQTRESCKCNLETAKRELCWEKESDVLQAAYSKLFETMGAEV